MQRHFLTLRLLRLTSSCPRPSPRRHLRPWVALACVAVAAWTSTAQAQLNSYSWLTITGTNWSDTNRWQQVSPSSATVTLANSFSGTLDFTSSGNANNTLLSGTALGIIGGGNTVLSGTGITLTGNILRTDYQNSWTIPIDVPTGVSSTWTFNNTPTGYNGTDRYAGALTGGGTVTINPISTNNMNSFGIAVSNTTFAGTLIITPGASLSNSNKYVTINNLGPNATLQTGGGSFIASSGIESAFVLTQGGLGAVNQAAIALPSMRSNTQLFDYTFSGSIQLAAVFNTTQSTQVFGQLQGAANSSLLPAMRGFVTGNVRQDASTRNMFVNKGTWIFSGSNSWTGTTGVVSGSGANIVFTRPLALYSGSTSQWVASNFSVAADSGIGVDVNGFSSGELNTFYDAVTGAGWGSGARFVIYSGSTGTFSKVLSNPTSKVLGLIKSGNGEVVVDVTNNTYTGVTQVQGGTLTIGKFGNGGEQGSIGQATSAAANLILGVQSTAVLSRPAGSVLKYTGAGETTDRSLTLVNGQQYTNGQATIDASGSGELIMTGTAAVWLQTQSNSYGYDNRLYLGGTNTGTNVFGLALTDPGPAGGNAASLGVSKIGPGTWRLSGTNAMRNGLTISSGKMILGNTAAAGAGTLTMGLVAGESVGGTAAPILGLDFTGTLTQGITGTTSGANTTSNTIEVFANRLATVLGTVSGTLPLAINGSGTLAFSGSNSYRGTTTVANGQLRLSSTFALPGGIGSSGAGTTGTSALVIGTGTSSGVVGLAINDFLRGLGTSATNVQFVNGGFAAYGADRTVNFGGAGGVVTWDSSNTNFSSTGTFVLGSSDSGNKVIFANQLTGTGAGVRNVNIVAGTTGTAAEFTNTLTISSTTTLRKIGSGLLRLTGSTVGSGTFDVAAGTLQFGSGSAAASAGRFLVSSTSSTLDLGGNTLSAATVGLSAGQVLGSLDSTRLDISNVTDTASISGAVTGGGALTKGGAGRLTLSSSNSYNGTMTVNAGEVRLNSGDGLRNAALAGSSGSVSFGTGVTAARFAALDGSAAVSLTNAGSGAVTLTLGSSGTYGGVISGAGGLVVQNIRQRLDSASTFTGETLIGTGGTLAFGSGGSLASSATITVGGAASTGLPTLDLTSLSSYTFNAAQTLRGNGTIKTLGTTTVTVNGLLSPGNSPGTLAFDQVDVALGPQSNTLMEIAGLTQGTQYDFVNLTNGGNLTYGGTMELNFSQTFESGTFNLFFFADSSGSFDQVVATGAYTGTFSRAGSVYTLSGSQTMTFTQDVSGGGGGFGQLVIVPEPLALGLLGIGSGVAMLAHRRMRRRNARSRAGNAPADAIMGRQGDQRHA